MFISGIGRTKFGKLPDSLVQLAYKAITNAINDSPLNISDIDAIFVSNFLGGPLNGQLHLNSMIASFLPQVHIPIIRIETACASSSIALNQALQNLGKFSNILIVGAEKMSGKVLMSPTDAIAMASDYELDFKNGLIFPASYAIIAQQYMKKFHVEHEILEKISYINHKNANLNPFAHFYYKEVSMEMIKKSPIIASPLNLFDCSPISDGAVAIIVSNRKQSERDIQILGSSIATDSISLTQRKDFYSFNAAKIATKNILKGTNVKLKDIDIFEIHDCFTISQLIALEHIGLCELGEAKNLIERGDILIHGSTPVNTDGGLKANGHPIGATGLAQIFELVTQLRFEAGKRQVSNPEIGLSHNIGGIGGTCGITLLRG